MASESSLPPELRRLFPQGRSSGKRLEHSLPPGYTIPSVDDDDNDDDQPVLWLSHEPAPRDLWGHLRAEHEHSGLWPLLLPCDGISCPWDENDLFPHEMSTPTKRDSETILKTWWEINTANKNSFFTVPLEEINAEIAPFTQTWPGLTPALTLRTDPDRVADEQAEKLLADNTSCRLGLVAADTGSEALITMGWTGPANHTSDMTEISAVIRDWEDRFGVRVVGVGFDTLHLSVAAPPATRTEALHVAAEHFALCPDNVWQGVGTLAEYAKHLIDDDGWSFWWD